MVLRKLEPGALFYLLSKRLYRDDRFLQPSFPSLIYTTPLILEI